MLRKVGWVACNLQSPNNPLREAFRLKRADAIKDAVTFFNTADSRYKMSFKFTWKKMYYQGWRMQKVFISP